MRWLRTQSLASQNSSFIPISHRVSSESTRLWDDTQHTQTKGGVHNEKSVREDAQEDRSKNKNAATHVVPIPPHLIVVSPDIGLISSFPNVIYRIE